jgi:signal transduction histidine kinase
LTLYSQPPPGYIPSTEPNPSLINALRTMPLFEAMSGTQLRWLAKHAATMYFEAGERVFGETQPADYFWVLMEGEWRLTRIVGGYETHITTSGQRGSWAGAVIPTDGTYPMSATATRDSKLLRISMPDLRHMLANGFPIASHLIAGVSLGARRFEALVSQQEKLAALGKLSAGLAHELNNPASAAQRSAARLHEVLELSQAEGLDFGELTGEQRRTLRDLRRDAVDRARAAPELTPLERSDREDALTAWLNGRGLEDGWELAPSLLAAGLDPAWLEAVAERVPTAALGTALRWIALGLEATGLVRELEGSTHRISELVGSIRDYTFMDRAPRQEIDVHDGLESTLIMLGHRLRRGIRVEREYDRSLPRIPANGSELNQVWTNLLDNALDAMNGGGTLRLHTARDGDQVLVEIGDDGPGVPTDLRTRIWEPFFTTKPQGEGTGLGLDVSYRIVVAHRGDIAVESEPGDTRFQVRLPVE